MTTRVDSAFAEALGVDQSLAQQMFDRLASPDVDRWYDQVRRVGYCARPVWLEGTVRNEDGTVRYATSGEPAGRAVKALRQQTQSGLPVMLMAVRR
jgi:hypothetical protein